VKQGGRVLIAVLGLILLAPACGGGTKVGTAFKNFQGQQAGQRLGNEATPAPSAKAAAATAAPVVQHRATPRPTVAAQQQSALTIQITAGGFNPTTVRVYSGSLITVTNVDSSPHSYTSSDATYDTGMLAPHQSKTFTANASGNFQIEDKSRNWIIGSLQVVHR